MARWARSAVVAAATVPLVLTLLAIDWQSGNVNPFTNSISASASSEVGSATPARGTRGASFLPTRVTLGGRPFINSMPPLFHDAHGGECGTGLLLLLGLNFSCNMPEKSDQPTFAALTIRCFQSGPNYYNLSQRNFMLVSRAVGPVLAAASVEPLPDGSWSVVFPPLARSGQYLVDVVLSWVAARFVGQRWMLPSRNDDPPFAEKKRKCLQLTLQGDCERFGYTILASRLQLTGFDVPPQRECRREELTRNGNWLPVPSQEAAQRPLLVDSVGLNTFRSVGWMWSPTVGCQLTMHTAASLEQCFARLHIARIAFVGDSMMLEQFHMLKSILVGPNAKLKTARVNKLRHTEFTTAFGVTVRFMRSYTTSGGHSVIAAPLTIASQIHAFSPSLVVANLAVLHWQQNMRTLAAWQSNLNTFQRAMHNACQKISHFYYLGPTLIQMGRTQGLQPRRTSAFAAVARDTLSGGACRVRYLSPYNLSVSRRESAFDGQHWACYHEVGGVAHVIAQLFLNDLCGNSLEEPAFTSV